MDGVIGAVRTGDARPHRLRILGAEVENVADLDAARGDAPLLRQRREGRLVVLLVGRRVGRGPALDDRREVGAEIRVLARHLEVEERLVAEDGALAGVGEDDEFVAEVAADRAGIGAHRDGLQAEPREGPEIGDEHAVVGCRAPS